MHNTILFVPHNAYHTYTMSLVVPHLESQGVRCVFANIDSQYINEGVGAEARRLGLSSVEVHDGILERERPAVMVVMNDWGGLVRDLVLEANRRRIPTVGIVEGVQDFEDTHVAHIGVGQLRHPYQTVKYPFLTGDYDRRFFPNRPSRVIGIPRIEPLLTEEPVWPEPPRIAINSNFTYSLYTNDQARWLEEATTACERLGLDFVITQHHADKADLSAYPLTQEPIHDVIRGSSVLISRFSTCILEAMALGKPSVYHNPHGERVDVFQNPMGAYRISHTVDELVAGLEWALSQKPSYREQCRRFFEHHVSVTERSSAQRVAEALLEILRSDPPPRIPVIYDGLERARGWGARARNALHAAVRQIRKRIP